MNETRAAPSTWLLRYAPLGALLAGVLLRVGSIGATHSLEMDEQMLAINIVSRTHRHLLAPLDLQQVAPPAFLQIERLVVDVGGFGDTSLRLVPFLAGVVCLLLIGVLCERLGVHRRVTLLALGIAGVSPMLVSYAAILKPYSTDAMTTAILLTLTVPLLQPGDDERGSWLALVVAGGIALTLSLPSVFVLAGVVASLAVARWRYGAGPTWRRQAAGALLWGSMFVIVYAAFYRQKSQSAGMHWFWKGDYLADQLSVAHPGIALARMGTGLTSSLYAFWSAPGPEGWLNALVPLLALAGVVWLVRTDRLSVAVLLVTPILGAIAASGIRQYIFGGRLLLYLAPILCVLIAAGCEAVCTRLPKRVDALAFVMLALALLLPAARHAAYPFHHREEWAGAGTLAREALRRADSTTVTYVYSRALPGWTLYTNDWRAADTTRVAAQLGVAAAIGFNSGLIPSRGRAVSREGDEFQHATGARVELYGIGTGMGPRSTGAPDLGWAENEVRRMRAMGRRSVLIYAGDFTLPSSLFAALDSAGAQRVFAHEIGPSHLYEYQLATPPAY
jgi:hypothetical protein